MLPNLLLLFCSTLTQTRGGVSSISSKEATILPPERVRNVHFMDDYPVGKTKDRRQGSHRALTTALLKRRSLSLTPPELPSLAPPWRMHCRLHSFLPALHFLPVSKATGFLSHLVSMIKEISSSPGAC